MSHSSECWLWVPLVYIEAYLATAVASDVKPCAHSRGLSLKLLIIFLIVGHLPF